MFLQCIALRDCKIWYENGYTLNGNYTIYPNGEIPLEVSIYKSLLVHSHSLLYIYIYLYRYIVIWKVLIVMVKVVGLE